MYVFDPTYTLLYDVPLNENGNVRSAGAVHERETCALPAVPVTSVGSVAATAVPGCVRTTTPATSEAAHTTRNKDDFAPFMDPKILLPCGGQLSWERGKSPVTEAKNQR